MSELEHDLETKKIQEKTKFKSASSYEDIVNVLKEFPKINKNFYSFLSETNMDIIHTDSVIDVKFGKIHEHFRIPLINIFKKEGLDEKVYTKLPEFMIEDYNLNAKIAGQPLADECYGFYSIALIAITSFIDWQYHILYAFYEIFNTKDSQFKFVEFYINIFLYATMCYKKNSTEKENYSSSKERVNQYLRETFRLYSISIGTPILAIYNYKTEEIYMELNFQ